MLHNIQHLACRCFNVQNLVPTRAGEQLYFEVVREVGKQFITVEPRHHVGLLVGSVFGGGGRCGGDGVFK